MSERTLIEKGWYSNCQQVKQTDADGNEIYYLWGQSEKKGTPFVQVAIQGGEGSFLDKVRTERLYMSPGARPHTEKKIRAMGWRSNDWQDIEDEAHGNACLSVKIEHEEYEGSDGETYFSERIAFITDKGGGRSVTPMSKDNQRSFIAQLNAGMSSAPQSNGPGPDDDLPF